jgi:protein subunit release factor B
MIRITDAIAIDEREIEERFVRSGGPGGQNVNKLATAVQLRFAVRGSPSLPEDVRARLERLAGRRLTQDGVLISRRSAIAPRNATARTRWTGWWSWCGARRGRRRRGDRPGPPRPRGGAGLTPSSAAA